MFLIYDYLNVVLFFCKQHKLKSFYEKVKNMD